MLEGPVKTRMILISNQNTCEIFFAFFLQLFMFTTSQCIAEMGGVTLKVCRKKVVMITSMNAV